MLINIKDISKMFCEFWEKSSKFDLHERKIMWEQLYKYPNNDIFSHLDTIYNIVYKNYSIYNYLEESFKKYELHYDRIKTLSGVIESRLYEICKSCNGLFKINDIELNFITMVGQFQANAFVTPYNGTTAFYFIEQMPEQKYLDILLAHEITHLFHFSQLKEEDSKATLAKNIFIDGLACFTSSVICRGFSKAVYLSFDSESDKWLIDCESYLPKLKNEIIKNIESTEQLDFLRYFSKNNESTSGMPNRIGYLIGFNVISYLSKAYSLEELILWESDRINKEVKNAILNII